ncbi:MAG: hypothetical protein WCS42_11605 [Verrucomicrobiota bacterium]
MVKLRGTVCETGGGGSNGIIAHAFRPRLVAAGVPPDVTGGRPAAGAATSARLVASGDAKPGASAAWLRPGRARAEGGTVMVRLPAR